MNANSTKCNSPCTVVSEYFSSKPVMDESLSEFKEKKGSCKGPKNSQKLENKVKRKRVLRKTKGQKDIRTALKNNDQVKYAKEFDEVCKQAGVDVDSEQLQLAIALSKSLQSTEDIESSTQKPLNLQERTKNIRKTLREYGFAVPEIKTTKKKRKSHKQYKLLLTTEAEKQEIICDKYTQVLFSNASNSKAINHQYVDNVPSRCYHVATGVSYMTLKNNNIFYIEDLIERSTSKGSMLKDWAKIPGRPESPVKREIINMNFSEIECSQDEIDIVLSGTLKSAKDVVRAKVHNVDVVRTENAPMIIIDDDDNTRDDKTLVNEELIHVEGTEMSNKTLSQSSRVRSYSPDIFDDEVSLVLNSQNDTGNKFKISKTTDGIMDLTQHDKNDDMRKQSLNVNKPYLSQNKNCIVMDLTQNAINYNINPSKLNESTKSPKPTSHCSQISNFTRRHSEDFMEMTRCVGFASSNTNTKDNQTHSILKLSQGSNKVRRYSDELMEVIGCVASSQTESSQNLHTTNSQVTNITKRKSNDLMEMTECVASTSHVPLDLEVNNVPIQHLNEVNTASVVSVNNIIKVDLSQSSNSDDELPSIQMTESNKSLDDTIILNSDDIIIKKPLKHCANSSDLTQDLTDTSSSHAKTSDKLSNKSFFDEFDYNHSEDTSKETIEKSAQSEMEDVIKVSNNNDEIDLTQSSNSSVAASPRQNTNDGSMQTSKSSLGKKDNVSIDYDEMYDLIANDGTDANTNKNDSDTSAIYDGNDTKGSGLENMIRNSQVFDISDKELEYSLNQSRHDVAWGVNLGGISVIDGDLSVRKSEINPEKVVELNQTNDESMSESFLPMVKVKSNEDAPNNCGDRFKTSKSYFNKEKAVTPFKAFTNDNAVTIDTPTSNQYIVKTDQVTPILDYASMSTPERNRELDKYGLKPFKRKRAIQLLTHLYNQTHPIVETCQEELPSPSKRRKPSQPSPKKLRSPLKSPRMVKSPRKLSKSPKNVCLSIENQNNEIQEKNVYEVTNETPEIKAIECSEDDWVFQKREKAKLHSCRVPLHIALFNYVSCRRRLREAILRYEPVNIDVIHKELATSGHRYDPKDLLKYLDKKCITVKTVDNNTRNIKK